VACYATQTLSHPTHPRSALSHRDDGPVVDFHSTHPVASEVPVGPSGLSTPPVRPGLLCSPFWDLVALRLGRHSLDFSGSQSMYRKPWLILFCSASFSDFLKRCVRHVGHESPDGPEGWRERNGNNNGPSRPCRSAGRSALLKTFRGGRSDLCSRIYGKQNSIVARYRCSR
jgi:hypothetical protein